MGGLKTSEALEVLGTFETLEEASNILDILETFGNFWDLKRSFRSFRRGLENLKISQTLQVSESLRILGAFKVLEEALNIIFFQNAKDYLLYKYED